MKAVIYGSTTGNTKAAAEKIAAALGGADVLSVSDAASEDLEKYAVLIFGTSTWGIGDLQDDWEENISVLDTINYSGKTVAVFSLGDQEGYPDSFVDAMGILKSRITQAGGRVTGEWSVDGYHFDSSAAVEGDHFAGLALDEDNQSNLSDERIESWVKLL